MLAIATRALNTGLHSRTFGPATTPQRQAGEASVRGSAEEAPEGQWGVVRESWYRVSGIGLIMAAGRQAPLPGFAGTPPNVVAALPPGGETLSLEQRVHFLPLERSEFGGGGSAVRPRRRGLLDTRYQSERSER